MGYPVRAYVEGYWYHVCTRGQREEPLFFSPEDRVTYLRLLDRTMDRLGGKIGSFCLMTNHLHLLLKMGETSLGRVLKIAHSEYARGFNKRRNIRGHLTQGRPVVKVILDKRYLNNLVGYVHMNPVEAGIADFAQDYKWSSWYWFLGIECDWINLDTWCYPPGFSCPNRVGAFKSCLRACGSDMPGDETYIGLEKEWNEFYQRRQEGREAQAFQEKRGRKTMLTIAQEVVDGTEYTTEEIRGRSKKRPISNLRREAMAKMYEEGYGTSDIARWFNRSPSTVSKAHNWWREKSK